MDLQRNRRLTPSLLLVITALGLIRTPEVFAADPGGLDLVVLVDQSGSMSGHGTSAKNDPYNVRNHMVTFTLDLMAENAVLNQVTHRLGVISFGTTVRIDLPLSEPPRFGKMLGTREGAPGKMLGTRERCGRPWVKAKSAAVPSGWRATESDSVTARAKPVFSTAQRRRGEFI